MKYKYTFECEIPNIEYFKNTLGWENTEDLEYVAERISENPTYDIVRWWSSWDEVTEYAWIEKD